MKKRDFIFVLMSVCFLYACTNDDMNIPVVNEQKTEMTEEAGLNAAKDLLVDFVGETYARSSSSFKIKNHRIRTVHVNNIDGLPSNAKEAIPVYEFTTETDGKEGYSVVVSDERVDKVLISVPRGSLADTAFIEPLRWYYNDIPLLIEQDLELYNKEEQKTTAISRMTVENIYRFTPTIWGQLYPYNIKCPNQYPAGCFPIAVAQILAYHRLPSNLNWTSILASSTLTSSSSTTDIDQVSTLVYNIGANLDTHYTDSVSWAYFEDIPEVLTAYGLQNWGVVNFTIENGKYSLQNGGPFIMYANHSNSSVGHGWVCDGWKRHIYDDATYYDYLNMNWGWDGSSNGFYYVENPMSFRAGGYIFNHNFLMIYNIRR